MKEAKKYIVPESTDAQEIKRIRKKLSLTQQEFAALIGTSKSTVERWEMGKSPVTGPLVLLLQMLDHDPGYIKEIEIPEKTFPLRLWYMYRNRVCTLIDVDELRHIIRIRNYADNVMFCAFGVKLSPTWEDYQEFLADRCFPEGRDKMKLVLRDLDIPFYDPFLIIQKTEGRMAEDDFWIRIEK